VELPERGETDRRELPPGAAECADKTSEGRMVSDVSLRVRLVVGANELGCVIVRERARERNRKLTKIHNT